MALRYQVPQFIDLEDKIVGPLTLKQFLLYFSTVLLLIPVYLYSDLSLFITIALPVMAAAAAFAHLRPGGKSLFAVVMNFFGFISQGQIWTWRRTAHPKPLLVRGIELEAPTLQQKMQSIETAGNVQAQADVEDPMIQEGKAE